MNQDEPAPPISPEAPRAKGFSEMQQDLLTDLFEDQLLTDAYQRLTVCQQALPTRPGEPDAAMLTAVREAIAQLVQRLEDRRRDSSDREWKDFVKFCLLHPLRELVHQDPFTCRAFAKPRGYVGDPDLLDLIYSVEAGKGPPEETSPLGRLLFLVTTSSDVCHAVRARRRVIAQTIEQLAAAGHRPAILSVASSHLREADLCPALAQGRIGRWVALDWDTNSLREVLRCYGRYGIETVAATVRQLLDGQVELGTSDLIYSVAIYDYLQQAIGKRLLRRLFSMLRPGGQLLVGNLSPEVWERGYMESYMNWHLIYRTHAEMLDLAANLDPAEIQDVRLLTEGNDKMLFLRLLRK